MTCLRILLCTQDLPPFSFHMTGSVVFDSLGGSFYIASSFIHWQLVLHCFLRHRFVLHRFHHIHKKQKKPVLLGRLVKCRVGVGLPPGCLVLGVGLCSPIGWPAQPRDYP
jgi:hypothetical protein